MDWIGLAQDRYRWLHNLWPLEWYSAPQSVSQSVSKPASQPASQPVSQSVSQSWNPCCRRPSKESTVQLLHHIRYRATNQQSFLVQYAVDMGLQLLVHTQDLLSTNLNPGTWCPEIIRTFPQSPRPNARSSELKSCFLIPRRAGISQSI
jgi:hypothetical protein